MTDLNTHEMMIHQLLNIDFKPERGYSYAELLNFLNTFQAYYRDCYVKKDNSEKDLIRKNKTFTDLENRIIYLEKLLKDKNIENNHLLNKITKKLTIWERLTGKVKIN